jgi:hypothetical protein
VLGVAALVYQSLWGLVTFANLDHLLNRHVSLAEVCTESTLSVVYMDHANLQAQLDGTYHATVARMGYRMDG